MRQGFWSGVCRVNTNGQLVCICRGRKPPRPGSVGVPGSRPNSGPAGQPGVRPPAGQPGSPPRSGRAVEKELQFDEMEIEYKEEHEVMGPY